MRIRKGELLTMVEFPPGLEVGMVLHRLHKHYCDSLNYRSQCQYSTDQCRLCQPRLHRIFQKIQEAQLANPYGFLVWAIRSEVASLDEARESKGAEVRQNAFGERIEANPFGLLLEEL
jgi:hypothetical protein